MKNIFSAFFFATALFAITGCGSSGGKGVATNSDGSCTDDLLDDAFGLQSDLGRMQNNCDDLKDGKAKVTAFITKYGTGSCTGRRNGATITFNGSVHQQNLDLINDRMKRLGCK